MNQMEYIMVLWEKDACQNNPFGKIDTITLNLSNVNGKWLISSMDAGNLVNSIIK